MTKMVAANCWSEYLYPKIQQAEDFSPDQFYKPQVSLILLGEYGIDTYR